jgi:hypothetical protein
MEELMSRPVGVSIFSFLPRLWLPGGYKYVRDTIGGLGIQLLPLRGMRSGHIQDLRVLSFEGPWNCGSIRDAIKRHMGYTDRGYPSGYDIVLFGSEKLSRARVNMIASLHPRALAIDVPWVSGSAIELGTDMYGGNARQWDGKQPSGVVLDTGHWQELGRNAEKKLLELGGESAIRMVHLKLVTPQEIMGFLHGGNIHSGLLCEFLAHDKAGRIPVIIETMSSALRLPGQGPKVLLQRIADRIHSTLD